MGYGRPLCAECKHGKDRYKTSCYCVKYGIMIGYSKRECRGFESEVQESEGTGGRDHVRQQEGSEQVGRVETA